MEGLYGISIYTENSTNFAFNYFGENEIEDFEMEIDSNLSYSTEYFFEI